ncbi:MAG: hypothetical protein ACR2IM_10505 [Sediminibacterium sp.]|jgi:hypothetical protein
MKRIYVYASFLTFIIIGLTGCYKDVIYPAAAVDPDGPPQAVSFKTDLMPVFNSSCAKAGCHLTGGHKPYLSSDVSYGQITNGGFVNLLVPKQSILYEMINGDMKTYMPSATDRQKVYDWIRNGAPNN